MTANTTRLRLGQPAAYCIKAQGILDASWADHFEGLTISQSQPVAQEPLTVLTGQVVDQLMLLGILNRLCNLGLPICSVEWLNES
ncbi:MAG: hypothetical protein AAF614_42840 [Chloroflexota bacterium]